MNITNDELRIKVAEACGWVGIRGETGYPTPRAHKLGDYQSLPNYPSDLNACASFEQTLTEDEWPEYTIRLSGEEMSEGWPTCFLNLEAVKVAASATARQRCIAYLKTKGILP